jgi:uncharacterized protein involved in outer membrane biogenesis
MKKRTKIILIVICVAVFVLSITMAILVRNANRIIKHELESLLGKDFTVKQINLHWGKVEAIDIRLTNPSGKEVFKTDSLILEADFIGLLEKKYILSKVSLENPYIFLEKNKKGELINPFLRKKPEKESGKPTTPVFFKNIYVKNGSLDFLDRKVSSKPVLTKLRDINLELNKISFPYEDNFSGYSLSASILGNHSTGTLKSKGKIKLMNKDMDGKLELKGLDLTAFKPYFQKKGDVNVTKGLLDMDMDVRIKSKKINSPGKATLRNLEFERGSGIGNKFLKIPLSAVVSFLKNNNNEIVVNFVVKGDLDNPKFDLKENFIENITIGIAGKLGLSITRIGESIVVLGTEGVKQVEKGIKGLGEGIKEIFK